MAIITISRGSFSGAKEFAEHLAEELGYTVISREDLAEEATKWGVPVGKLQTAMVKPPRYYLRMGQERDQYIACVTYLLCHRILKEDVIYHGHTGHLLLAGIPHILRIRVLTNTEKRIKWVQQHLDIPRDKAKKYIDEIDADRDKWVRFLYNIDWHDPSHYDLIVNMDQLGFHHATSALRAMAELPDFKLTPASMKAIRNLHLASKATFALGQDPRVKDAQIKITADDGIINVTYMPYQTDIIQYVPEILAKIPECKDVKYGIAHTNILWLQDHYDVTSGAYRDVLRLAKKWDAAVELMRMVNGQNKKEIIQKTADQNQIESQKKAEYTGGILDDTDEEPVGEEDVNRTLDELQKEGYCGGITTVYGDTDTLLSTLRKKSNYRLIIVGKLFTHKAEAARKRMTNELKNLLTENIQVPVVGLEELAKQIRFGAKEIIRSLVHLCIAILIFVIIFSNQELVLQLLAGEKYESWRVFVIIGLVILIPSFAYFYGNTARRILKVFGLD